MLMSEEPLMTFDPSKHRVQSPRSCRFQVTWTDDTATRACSAVFGQDAFVFSSAWRQMKKLNDDVLSEPTEGLSFKYYFSIAACEGLTSCWGAAVNVEAESVWPLHSILPYEAKHSICFVIYKLLWFCKNCFNLTIHISYDIFHKQVNLAWKCYSSLQAFWEKTTFSGEYFTSASKCFTAVLFSHESLNMEPRCDCS